MTDRFSPLHQLHVDSGASFTDFGGWQMPVRYSGDLAEHHAVRTAAGLFDISHMAEFRITGAGASDFLDFALAGKLSAIADGQAKYTLMLSEDGGIVDDLVVYRLAAEDFLVVANAGNHDSVAEALADRADLFTQGGAEVEIADQSDDTALIALQGPLAATILPAIVGLDDAADTSGVQGILALRYYRATSATFNGASILVGRTGYTGEDGFEFYIPSPFAVDFWNAALAAGASHGLVPAGLASRDTLRLEAGMPLYGHELGLEIAPAEAGLGRTVALDKPGDFIGREGVESGAEPILKLVGLKAEGRRAARADYDVFLDEQSTEPIGVITSGALSPTLGEPIAMAFLPTEHSHEGTEVSVDIRGRRLAYRVVNLPFYTRSKPGAAPATYSSTETNTIGSTTDGTTTDKDTSR